MFVLHVCLKLLGAPVEYDSWSISNTILVYPVLVNEGCYVNSEWAEKNVFSFTPPHLPQKIITLI